MIDFKNFKADDSAPIYLQIISYIKSGIVSETIKTGDELPSRRVLSALLGVNPNTVQKAYHILEEEGIIVSQAGLGSNISVNENTKAQIKESLTKTRVEGAVNSLKQMGLTKEEALELLERYW